jgi:hypothetical protein
MTATERGQKEQLSLKRRKKQPKSKIVSVKIDAASKMSAKDRAASNRKDRDRMRAAISEEKKNQPKSKIISIKKMQHAASKMSAEDRAAATTNTVTEK